MVRDRREDVRAEDTISIVGMGMKFVGDCETDGALRIEGTVEGSVRAGGEVVIGPKGVVQGDVHARDATVAGTVTGRLIADGRLELRDTSRLDGEVFAARIRVGDGAIVNAALHMGEAALAGARESRSQPTLRIEAPGEEPVAAEGRRRTS